MHHLLIVLILFFTSSCSSDLNRAPVVYIDKNHKQQGNIIDGNSQESYVQNTQKLPSKNTIEIIDPSVKITEEDEDETENKESENSDSNKQLQDNKLNENDYVIPEPDPNEKYRKIISHQVQLDETIEDIAIKYDQTIEEIARVNKLFPPYEIEPYQSLKIIIYKKDDEKITKPKLQVKKVIATKLEQSPPKFIKPLGGQILTKFGQKTKYGINKGINIKAESGTSVISSTSGKVIYANYDATFGNLVLVKGEGSSDIVTAYAHLEEISVKKNANISQGEIIGYVGNSGKVDSSQLHFAIRKGKKAIDPELHLKFN